MPNWQIEQAVLYWISPSTDILNNSKPPEIMQNKPSQMDAIVGGQKIKPQTEGRKQKKHTPNLNVKVNRSTTELLLPRVWLFSPFAPTVLKYFNMKICGVPVVVFFVTVGVWCYRPPTVAILETSYKSQKFLGFSFKSWTVCIDFRRWCKLEGSRKGMRRNLTCQCFYQPSHWIHGFLSWKRYKTLQNADQHCDLQRKHELPWSEHLIWSSIVSQNKTEKKHLCSNFQSSLWIRFHCKGLFLRSSPKVSCWFFQAELLRNICLPMIQF